MNICDTCKYWSDTVAKWHGNGQQFKALCLNKDSQHAMQYTTANDACSQYSAGVPIDVRSER